MADQKDDIVPTVAAIKRLGRYLQQLRPLLDHNVESVSASQISRDLGIHETQIRRDFALVGLEGKPKVGHDLKEAIRVIEGYLNVDNTSDAALVGVGHLGTALLAYNSFNRFESSGIKIVTAFDKNPEIIDTKVHSIHVFDIERFENLVKRMSIHIGVLTTTPAHAQEVANLMVKSGILAIWNFAPVNLKLPPEIILENAEIESGLAYISHMLKNRMRK